MTLYDQDQKSTIRSSKEYISSHAQDFEEKQKEKKGDGGFGRLILIILVAILPIVGTVAFIVPYIFLPHENSYSIAVQLENGELVETKLGMWGAVNNNDEFLIDYNASALAAFAGLYLDEYIDARGLERSDIYDQISGMDGWIIYNAVNPYYDGKIQDTSRNTRNYLTTETVYDSINESHWKDTYYDADGTVVWEYEGNKKGNDLFQTVIETNSYRPGETISTKELYINVNQFLIEKYGLDVEITCDKANQLIIFHVPKTATPLAS